jgi:hypothetical protein
LNELTRKFLQRKFFSMCGLLESCELAGKVAA